MRHSISSMHMSFGNQHELYITDCKTARLRVCHENMHAVLSVFLIFTLCLQHEPFEDVIIPCDDAACNQPNVIRRHSGSPNFQGGIVTIVLVSTRPRYLRCGVLSPLPFRDHPQLRLTFSQ